MTDKEKKENLSLALRRNLKKEKIFKKKIRKKINNVSTFR